MSENAFQRLIDLRRGGPAATPPPSQPMTEEHPVAAATRIGLQNAQTQAKEKDAVKEKVNELANAEITTKVDLATGKETFSGKNVPVEFFKEMGGAKPENATAPTPAPAPAPPKVPTPDEDPDFYDVLAKYSGRKFTPPSFDEIAALARTEQGVRQLSASLGANQKQIEKEVKMWRRGELSAEKVAELVWAKKTKRIADTYANFRQPIELELQQRRVEAMERKARIAEQTSTKGLKDKREALEFLDKNLLDHGSVEAATEWWNENYAPTFGPLTASDTRQLSGDLKRQQEEISRKRKDQELQEKGAQLAERRLDATLDAALRSVEAQKNVIKSQQQTNLFKLADDYRKDIEPFRKAADQLSKVEAFASRKTGEGDYGMILSFVSAIDDSVARIEEVTIARSTVGLVDQAKQMILKWKEGDLLTEDLRQRFVTTTREIKESLEPRRNETVAFYEQRAREIGADPSSIGPGMKRSQPTHKYVPGKGLVKVN